MRKIIDTAKVFLGFKGGGGEKKKVAKIFGFIFLLLLASFTLFSGRGKRELVSDSDKREIEKIQEMGMFTGDVNQEAYVQRIEKQFHNTQDQVDNLDRRMQKLEKVLKKISDGQGDISNAVLDLDDRIESQLKSDLEKLKEELTKKKTAEEYPMEGIAKGFFSGLEDLTGTSTSSQMELEIIEIEKIDPKKEGGRNVYLPFGSHCEGVLLTGVYASSEADNPLPVLIELKEAFYGPNKTRIPLKGAFAIGKATGDITSKRAVIQIVAISTVHSTGETFESEGNIGYLVDEQGMLGIGGEVIYNSGKELAMNFLAGFMTGIGEALADEETTSTTGSEGQVTKSVTGSAMKYGLFGGMSKSAEGIAGYYEKRLDELVPAVKINAGEKVYFIAKQGVEIEGLKISFSTGFGYID